MGGCPICGSEAARLGTRDFNDSCNDAFTGARNFPVSGLAVPFARCTGCGFIFSDWFADWTPADFIARIYNDDYVRADPPFAQARPRRLADWLIAWLGEGPAAPRILDYGGGTGLLAEFLRAAGLAALSYDPLYQPDAAPPRGRFDLVTAFEVVEHVPNQGRLFREMWAYAEPDGVLVFTTLLQPADIAEIGLDWWYARPRNGHLALHSHDSLARLVGDSCGASVALRSLGEELHVVFREAPEWLRPLLDSTIPPPRVNDPLPGTRSAV